MTTNSVRRRKVLVLAPPLHAVGGVQNYTRTLVAAFQEVLGADNVRVVGVPGAPEARYDGSFALSLRVKIRFAASALAAAMAWSPDLIVCTHVGVAQVARHIQKLTQVPYWTVLYGIEVWGQLPAGKQYALQGAQRLISITRFTLDTTIARQSLHESRALILPPALAKGQTFSPRPDGAASENSQHPIVLTVGRISASERYKGHDAMLEAWPLVLRRVPDAEYWIVGDGDDRPRLESRAQQLGIAPSVCFLGSVSPDELAVCYDKCCIFAMPARTELDALTPRGEGFGIVFLEAMVRAKPVVGPRIGAPAEFIRSGEHGLLVDPASAAEVANALIELLEDPARAQRMGAAGREWVLREFSFEKFCERLREGLQA
jgi:phosphatidylinositol alpha-1,6-mannosyltransferase